MRGLVLVVLVAGIGEDVAEGAGAVDAIEEPGSAEADLPVGLCYDRCSSFRGVIGLLYQRTIPDSALGWPSPG